MSAECTKHGIDLYHDGTCEACEHDATKALLDRVKEALSKDARYVCYGREHSYEEDLDVFDNCVHPDCIDRRALIAEIEATR